MFEFKSCDLQPGQVVQYSVWQGNSELTYFDVIQKWISDSTFRHQFNSVLQASPFDAFRFETPSVTWGTMKLPFEFVLLNTPSFSTRKTDTETFRSYFTDDDAAAGVVSFENLGKDATLIVPSPRTGPEAYGHLAAFLRNGTEEQTDALWAVVGNSAMKRMSDDAPVWVSTAGGGVAWLHVRIDDRPKYYGFPQYRVPRAQPVSRNFGPDMP